MKPQDGHIAVCYWDQIGATTKDLQLCQSFIASKITQLKAFAKSKHITFICSSILDTMQSKGIWAVVSDIVFIAGFKNESNAVYLLLTGSK